MTDDKSAAINRSRSSSKVAPLNKVPTNIQQHNNILALQTASFPTFSNSKLYPSPSATPQQLNGSVAKNGDIGRASETTIRQKRPQELDRSQHPRGHGKMPNGKTNALNRPRQKEEGIRDSNNIA